jgi:hypothetical protein
MIDIKTMILINEIKIILSHNINGLSVFKISILLLKSIPTTQLILDIMVKKDLIIFEFEKTKLKKVPFRIYKLKNN